MSNIKEPKYYALIKESESDRCFAVVCEKLTKERTMQAVHNAIVDEFGIECEIPDVDLSNCEYGETVSFVAELHDSETNEDSKESIEVYRTFLY